MSQNNLNFEYFQVKMEAVFCCPNPSQCPENGAHSVASIKNLVIFTENRASSNVEENSCSYTLYDHVQALQMSGTKIYSDYFFCRSCKLTKRKELATKCLICDTDIARCNSWLLSALAGGFHDMSQVKTHMVSNRSDPVIVKEDWLNDLMECLLTLLSRRSESFSPGENSVEKRGTTDYLEAIHNLDQEDIRMLMPKPRDLQPSAACPAWLWRFTQTRT